MIKWIKNLKYKENIISEKEKTRLEQMKKNPYKRVDSENMTYIEITQVNKYMKEFKKQDIPVDYGILINFPQPSAKSCNTKVEFVVV